MSPFFVFYLGQQIPRNHQISSYIYIPSFSLLISPFSPRKTEPTAPRVASLSSSPEKNPASQSRWSQWRYSSGHHRALGKTVVRCCNTRIGWRQKSNTHICWDKKWVGRTFCHLFFWETVPGRPTPTHGMFVPWYGELLIIPYSSMVCSKNMEWYTKANERFPKKIRGCWKTIDQNSPFWSFGRPPFLRVDGLHVFQASHGSNIPKNMPWDPTTFGIRVGKEPEKKHGQVSWRSVHFFVAIEAG